MSPREELMKGTAMVVGTRPLLQEQGKSTQGNKTEQCLQGGGWEQGLVILFLTAQEPAEQFRVSVYFLPTPGRRKLFP